MRHDWAYPRGSHGVTLIELLCVAVIILILATMMSYVAKDVMDIVYDKLGIEKGTKKASSPSSGKSFCLAALQGGDTAGEVNQGVVGV